jgi:hypothetical protein
MDTGRHVIAEGSYGAGLSWLIWAQRQPSGGAQLGADELMSMIRVTSADGRYCTRAAPEVRHSTPGI